MTLRRGGACYSNTTTLSTGNWGEWKTEQEGVGIACNNVSKDYYLNININGADQTPRRRLVVWNSLRKDVNEITKGNLILHGILQGLSPLKLQNEINFIKSDGTTITSALYRAPRDAPSSLPSVFVDSLIHDIINETNVYGMQECFWDENTETMQMCISGAYLPYRATTISRSLQIVGTPTNKPLNENFTLCEGNKYVDCDPETTGADLLVEDDIEAIGSIFSQGNIAADGTGFFSYLGNLADRITGLFVQDIDATGNIETSENVSAKHFKGDGSLLTNLPSLGAETDPQWSANFTNMQTDCPSDNYVYGIDSDGTLKCRDDEMGSGIIPIYLGSNLTATNAEYTTIFTIALTPSKMNIIQVYLAQSSPTNGVAIQNRAIISETGPIGNCNFVTQTGAGAERIDNIVASTNSADTGSNTFTLNVNVPFINTISCTILADANQKDLIIQFQSETAASVTTYKGSYYTNAVNE